MSDFLEKITARSWPLMTAAVVLVAGFMFWLNWASGRLGGDEPVIETVELPRVSPDVLASDPQRFSRGRFVVSPVNVVMRLGRAALAVDLPGLPGYPAILDRSALNLGIEPVSGDDLTLVGAVYALNDSLLDVYAQRGFFEPANRPSLEGHETFFLVDSLDLVFDVGASDQGSPDGQ